MTPRLNPYSAAHDSIEATLTFSKTIGAAGLEPSLAHLVKLRASQINGCAYCIHMHAAEARADDETEERLYLLSAWEESPLYSERERAALAWTEALTLVSETHAPDDAYERLAAQFNEEERVNLTLMIGVINVWNRIAIGFRSIHPLPKPSPAVVNG